MITLGEIQVCSVHPPSVDDQDSRYEARYEEMIRIAQKLPGLLLNPNVVTTNFYIQSNVSRVKYRDFKSRYWNNIILRYN